MTFRERLFATIRAARPVLEEPGVELNIEGSRIRLPHVAGLLLEKLVPFDAAPPRRGAP